MTVDKKQKSSDYEETVAGGRNFRKSDRRASTATTNPQSEPSSSPSNNFTIMGMLAQRLGSERSWAETFIPSTPTGTIMTPTESSIAGDERAELISSRHEAEDDHEEPPPSYAASESSSFPPQTQNVGPSNVLPLSDPEAAPLVDLPCSRRSVRKSRCHNFMAFDRHRREHRRSRRRYMKPIWWLGTIAFFTVLMSGWQFASNYILNSRPATKPFVPSKNITQHETTKSIHGTFTLHDSIDLSTTTGSIVITIDARPGDKPAKINVATKTGSISVSYKSSNLSGGKENQALYEREFETSIKSDTGSVSVGSLLHGNGGSTYIQTTTGSIHAKILTVGSGSEYKNSSLVTRSSTGTQHIDVLPLLKKDDRASINAVRAEHHVATGSMHVKYSPLWEGVVHGHASATGSVQIKGNDLEFQHNGSRDVYAWRGVSDPQEVTVELEARATGNLWFQC